MRLLLLDENSAIGLVINALAFLLVAPLFIGLLVMVLSKQPRRRRRGLWLASGLFFVGLGAGLAGLLPIPPDPYLLFFTFPLAVGLFRLLWLAGKPPQS